MGEIKRWHLIAPIFIMLAGFCWGLIGIFSRSLSGAELNPIQITLLRCMVTLILLVVILLAKDRQKLRVSFRDIWMFIGTGVCSIAFFNICYFISIGESTLSIACILLYTAPCFVMLMSCIFFHEKFTRQKLLALVLAFAGCCLAVGVFGEKLQTTPLGLLVGLGSGFGYALYSIFARVALRKYSWLTVITYTFLLASIALIPFSHPTEIFAVFGKSPSALTNAIALGVLSTLFPFLLYTKGLEHMETGKAALLTFVEPLVATMVGVLVFQEKFTVFVIGGGALIMLAIIVLSRKEKGL